MIDYTPHITQKRLTALRRLFHKHAETGMAEFWTTARIAEEAEALGLAPLMGESVSAPEARMGVPDEITLDKARQRAEEEGAQKRLLDAMNGVTGLVVDIRPDLPAHTVLRFDIDAVDVQESGSASHLPRREGFFSLHEGICHACGHDGHIALGLGLAHELVRLRECLTHNVRLLFQPGEEGCRGARAMAAAGLLDGARHMVAAHIGMWADCDHSLVCGAQGFLATTKFDVTFTGRAAHAGAEPHKGANSLLAAASAALNMHALPRHGEGDSRVTVGRLEAGSGRNTIPSSARMVCETRGASTAVNEYMFEHCRSIIEHTAAMYEQRCDIRIMGGSDGAGSDDALTHLVREIAGAVPWFRQELIRDSAPGFGSDDACVHMAAVQKQGGDAVYLMLGSDLAAGHHAPDFDFHEDMLLPSVELLTRLVIALDRR
ncbi:amidohydrolase [Mailhella massiliensis]|uniref:amidohydrolase n=1 Tax=Mailhella massiliensis TaxID=1903261 RepID=UPI00097DE597|nr:amidohydrolase [Mailhella massiliensis]